MNPIRVLVVDDSATVRRILRILISEDPELELTGVAANGRIALAMLAQDVPDLVTLDLEMPEVDGLAALRRLRSMHPSLPVVVFSSATARGAVATLEALSQGATDYVTKPSRAVEPGDALSCIRQQLLPKIKALCTRRTDPCLHANVPGSKAARANRDSRVEVVAIGTSTGGPNALAEVLSMLPCDLPVPVVVAQHMPAVFTHFLAERLAAVCALQVREAKGGERLLPGSVWIAPGGLHLAVSRQAGVSQLQLLRNSADHFCRPSVDVLFRSLADSFGASVLAIVMTGMGTDGLLGAREICAAGGRVWAQDANTSVVWGMPGLVVGNGLAERVLPLPMIGPELVQAVGAGRPSVSLLTAAQERSHEDIASDFRVPGATGI
jgi:two-component system, chemotaxis family, protein-glutamate methylesterase/glutaminase